MDLLFRFCPKIFNLLRFSKGVARILDWEGGQTTNHAGKDRKKRSSQSDIGFLIGGARNLVGDQFRVGGGIKSQLEM